MRLLTMLCGGLALCTLASAAGAASGASIGEGVKDRCKTELDSYCKNVKSGEGRLLACLYAHEDKLSSRCDYALYDASMHLEHAVAALAHGAKECKDDIDKHCAKVEAGEGRIIDCLEKHESKLSKRCREAMKDIGLE